eukprot:1423924-Lingulodinium_polyedra.AAC.1
MSNDAAGHSASSGPEDERELRAVLHGLQKDAAALRSDRNVKRRRVDDGTGSEGTASEDADLQQA